MKTPADILQFLQAHTLCVISTTGPDGQPQSAVVGFGQTDGLQIIFGTSLASRKARNIEASPRVSMVIGWEPQGTVQLEGTARRLEGAEAERLAATYITKAPFAVKFQDEGQAFYVVEPSWLRHTDITTKPWSVSELTF